MTLDQVQELRADVKAVKIETKETQTNFILYDGGGIKIKSSPIKTSIDRQSFSKDCIFISDLMRKNDDTQIVRGKLKFESMEIVDSISSSSHRFLINGIEKRDIVRRSFHQEVTQSGFKGLKIFSQPIQVRKNLDLLDSLNGVCVYI